MQSTGGDNDAILSATIDASGMQSGAREGVAANETLGASTKQMASLVEGASGVIARSTDRVVTSYSAQTRALNQYRKELDPFADSLAKAEERVRRIDATIASGGENVNRAIALRASAIQRLNELQNTPIAASLALDQANQAKVEAVLQARIRAEKQAMEADFALGKSNLEQGNQARAQSQINELLGIKLTQTAGAARESAAAFAPLIAAQQKSEQVAQAAAEQQAIYGEIATQLRAKLNPAQAAQITYNNSLALVGALYKSGAISAKEYQEAIALGPRALNAFAQSQGQVASGSRQLQFALTNLSFQVNDVIGGLLQGQGVFRIFAQQAGQFVQVFQQGGGVTAVLRGASEQIKAFATPTTAAVAGLAALGVAFAVIIQRAVQLQGELRRYNVLIAATGNVGNETGIGLQQLQRQIQATGVSAADAEKQIRAFFAAQGLNPLAAARITGLGRDISAGLGGDAADRTTALAKALQTSTEATIKLAQELLGPNGLDPALVKAARDLAEAGDKAGGTEKILGALEARFKGFQAAALSPSEEAWNRMRTSWDNLLNKLAETGAIQNALDKMRELLDTMEKISKGDFSVLSAVQAFGEGQSNFINKLGPGFINDLIRKVLPSGSGLNAQQSSQDLQDALRQRNGDLAIGGGGTQGITSSLIQRLIQVESGGNPNIFSSKGAGGLMQLMPGTARGLGVTDVTNAEQNVAAGIKYLQQQLDRFGTMEGALAAYNMGPAGYARVLRGERTLPAETRAYVQSVLGGQRSGLRQQSSNVTDLGTIDVTAAAPPAAAARNQVSAEFLNDQEKRLRGYAKENEALAQVGREEVRAKAFADAWNSSALDGVERQRFATEKATQAVAQWEIGLKKQSDTQNITNKGLQDSANAYTQGVVPGLQAAAKAQAELDVRAGRAGDVAARTAEILKTQAAEAVNASAKALPGLVLQTEQTGKLADAASKSTAALHEQQIQNDAVTATHDALNKALATGDESLIAQARSVQDLTEKQLRANDAQRTALELRTRTLENRNQIDVLNLEASLQGKTSEEIQAQVRLLEAKQLLQSKGVDLTSQEAKNYLEGVAALGKANIALAEATRQQQRIDDFFKGIGDTIDKEITQRLKDAFDGKKTQSFAKSLKEALSGFAAQATSGLFIRPLIGSVLQSIGLSNAATSFGSLGGGLGGGSLLSSIFGGSSGGLGSLFGGSQSLKITDNSGNVIGNLGSGSGLLDSGGGLLKELGLGDAFGGVKSFFNDIGGKLGFATNLQGPTQTGATLGTGSIFGSTSFGSFLGGAGAGFGLGNLLGGLTGATGLGSTLGSGAGSLLGAGLGSLVGLPMIGGLLGGGLGGLLSGLFGGKKPDMATSASFDFASGKFGGVQSHGVAENDQMAQAIAQSVGQFNTLLKQFGANVQGGITIAAGSRRGIVIDGSIGDAFHGSANFGQDTQKATQQIELAMIHSLTGVSDKVKEILGQVTDPADAEQALKFAFAYDSLSKAADSAFSEIEKDTLAIGPYAQAFDQINATFAELHDSAIKFGQSLDPIDKGLAEATKRLQGDFTKGLDDLVASLTGAPFIQALHQVEAAHGGRLRDAQAIGLGGDDSTLTKLDIVFKQQARQVLENLTIPQMNEVIAQFKDLDPALVELTTIMRDAAQAAVDLGQAIQSPVGQLIEQAHRTISTARGQDYINQLKDVEATYRTNVQTLVENHAGQNEFNINQLARGESFAAIMRGLDSTQLKVVVEYFKDFNSELTGFAQTVLDATLKTEAEAKAKELATQAEEKAKELAEKAEQAAALVRQAQQGSLAALGKDYLNSVNNLRDSYADSIKQLTELNGTQQQRSIIDASYNDQLLALLKGMDSTQLKEVITYFAALDSGLANLAQTILATTLATEQLNATQDLQRQYNEATERSYLNNIQTILDTQKANIEQATKLGLDANQFGKINEIAHQAIVTLMKTLTDDQMKVIEEAYRTTNPEIVKWIEEAKALRIATEKLNKETEIQTRLVNIQKNLLEYLNQLNRGTGADTTKSPADRYAESLRQFNEQYKKALAGDLDARENLTQYSDDLIRAIQDYYASSERGQQEIQKVKDQIKALVDQTAIPDDTVDLTVTAILNNARSTEAALSAVSAAVNAAIYGLANTVVAYETAGSQYIANTVAAWGNQVNYSIVAWSGVINGTVAAVNGSLGVVNNTIAAYGNWTAIEVHHVGDILWVLNGQLAKNNYDNVQGLYNIGTAIIGEQESFRTVMNGIWQTEASNNWWLQQIFQAIVNEGNGNIAQNDVMIGQLQRLVNR